ncbi:4-(cytidine 5'-diphospho)-2-C-methyl-D-erythritol kinase [Thalassospira sp. MA62]|nr:4-(cytidine 5'-diphospho)-2-C-methyl-D-erythritol kinase [Thalassospira sp. MA62]
MPEIYREHAPAKLNLFLHVTGKRDDGYHLLESLVCFTEAGDKLSGELRDDGKVTLTITGPMSDRLSHENTDDNLVMRAATLLKGYAPSKGADMTLEKHLPVASGIGGGSADAAAALRLLSNMWQLDLDDQKLGEIALSLGADVPVCLASESCLMSGIGETLTPIDDLPEMPLVLINPGKTVSTPEIFKAREEGAFTEPGLWDTHATFQSGASLAAALGECRNDLTLPATGILPEIWDVLNALAREEGCLLARMSGSGATCFAIYDTRAQAEQAAATIRAEHSDWWITPTKTRTEHGRILSNIGASFPD